MLVQIVSLGLDCFLKQLLEDNFVHTDVRRGRRDAVCLMCAIEAGGEVVAQPALMLL